ncbi:tripartite motif-containing protein 2-like [Ptychodera flava]|uniref:tripartite motif-containing protein 2-like n=1 Tax=Ptychodera flava TaxID=63121 RepID=UPI003969DCC2
MARYMEQGGRNERRKLLYRVRARKASRIIYSLGLIEYLQTNVKEISEQKGLVFEFGEKGSGDGHLYKPQSVATSYTGDVIVADSKNRLQIFTDGGKYKRKITFDHLDEKFVPSCVSIAKNDYNEELVYASDINNKLILVCNPYGNVVRDIGKDHLHMPGGVVVGDDGCVNIVDVWSNTVRAFGADNELVRKFGGTGDGEGELHQPKHMAVTKGGDLVIADTQNCRVQVFDATGRFLRKFGKKGKREGEFLCPNGIAVDRFGNVIVVDSVLRRVQLFTYWGRYIRRIDSGGDGLRYPEGVAVASSGAVYVADSGCHKIKVFQY